MSNTNSRNYDGNPVNIPYFVDSKKNNRLFEEEYYRRKINNNLRSNFKEKKLKNISMNNRKQIRERTLSEE